MSDESDWRPPLILRRQLTQRGSRSPGRLGRLAGLMCPTSLAAVACLLVCIAAPIALVVVHIDRNPTFSTEDEEAHFDYVQRISEGVIPRLGEQLLPSTNALVRCIGRPPEGFTMPACKGASRATLNTFYHSVDNAQYEAQQPPLYYAVTAVLRWPFIHVLHMHVLPGTRITGAIWLAAGLLLLWLAASVLGLDWPLIAAGALFVAAAPNVVLAASIVDNDGASIFAGGLVAVCGATAWRWPGMLRWWTFAVAGFIAVMLKSTCALPVIAVAVLLGVDACYRGEVGRESRRSLRERLACWLPSGAAMLLGALVAGIGWSIVERKLSLVNPSAFVPIQLAGSPQLSVAALASNALSVLYPFTSSSVPDLQWTLTGATPSNPWSAAFSAIDDQIIAMVAIAGGLSWLFAKEKRWPQWLGAVSLPTLYFGGLALGISIMISYRFTTGLPGRYGLPTSVLLILALIGALEGRWSRAIFTMFSVATFGLTFWFMLV